MTMDAEIQAEKSTHVPERQKLSAPSGSPPQRPLKAPPRKTKGESRVPISISCSTDLDYLQEAVKLERELKAELKAVDEEKKELGQVLLALRTKTSATRFEVCKLRAQTRDTRCWWPLRSIWEWTHSEWVRTIGESFELDLPPKELEVAWKRISGRKQEIRDEYEERRKVLSQMYSQHR